MRGCNQRPRVSARIVPAFNRAFAADRPVIIDVVTDIDALAPVAVSLPCGRQASAKPRALLKPCNLIILMSALMSATIDRVGG